MNPSAVAELQVCAKGAMRKNVCDDVQWCKGEETYDAPNEEWDEKRMNPLVGFLPVPTRFVEVRSKEETRDNEEERDGDACDSSLDEVVNEPRWAHDFKRPPDMDRHHEHRADDAHVLDLLTCLV